MAESVTEERRLGRQVATGMVSLAPGVPAAAEYRQLAGARAWAAVAEALRAAGDAEDACRAAQSGIDELADSYLAAGTEDDTSLKLLLAGEYRESEPGRAATLLLRVLENRIALFLEDREGLVQ